MPIELYYTRLEFEAEPENAAGFSEKFPFWVEEIYKFKNKADRVRSLVGKLLLVYALQRKGYANDILGKIQKDEWNRPFIPALKEDFNISHSGSWVVCALSDKGKIGVDMEEEKNIDKSDFDFYFTKNEKKKIAESSQPQRDFFRLWTRKEAFFKSLGGVYLDEVNHIDLTKDEVNYMDKNHYIYSLEFIPGYGFAFASEVFVKSKEIYLEELKFPRWIDAKLLCK